jgi:hypothetical protein
MKFFTAISFSIIAIISLSEAVPSEPVVGLTAEIIEARNEIAYLALIQRDVEALRERSVKTSPNPPKFSTFEEYENFEVQEKDDAPQECSQTSNEQTCQTCLAVCIGAWASGLTLCRATNDMTTGAGQVSAVTCAIGATALYWVSRIKCLAV